MSLSSLSQELENFVTLQIWPKVTSINVTFALRPVSFVISSILFLFSRSRSSRSRREVFLSRERDLLRERRRLSRDLDLLLSRLLDLVL